MSEKITTKEFASLTGISIPTLNRWAKQGKFAPAYPSEGQGKSAYYTADQMEPAKALHAKKAKPQTFAVFEESDLVNQPADNAVDLDISKNSCQCSIEGTAADVEKNSEATLGQPAADDIAALNIGDNGESTYNAPEMPAPMSDTTSPENDATDASENNAVKENSEGDGVEVVAPLILTQPPVAPPSLLPAKKIFSFTEIFDVGKADAPVYTPDPHLTLDERVVVIREVGKVEALAAIIRGQELIAAKAQVGHGNWEKWLVDNFGWADRTAQNYMQIARRFGKSKSAFLQFAKKSTLDAMLALPEGEEENFIEAQASEGRPVESQSARQIKRSVSEYKAKLQDVDAPDIEGSDKTVDVEKFQTDAQNDSSADFDFPDLDAIPTSYKPPIANVGNTATNEWYTPADIIEAARRVLGTIDLDPASCEKANQTVKATKFYSVDDNGLRQKWSGRVWLNPPYSKIEGTNSADETTTAFADKLVESLNSSDVTEAIWLSHNKTDTKWFCRLAEMSAAIVFSKSRINFLHDGVEVKGSPLHGQAFMYFGADPDKFIAEFSQFGWAAKFIAPQCEQNKAGENIQSAK